MYNCCHFVLKKPIKKHQLGRSKGTQGQWLSQVNRGGVAKYLFASPWWTTGSAFALHYIHFHKRTTRPHVLFLLIQWGLRYEKIWYKWTTYSSAFPVTTSLLMIHLWYYYIFYSMYHTSSFLSMYFLEYYEYSDIWVLLAECKRNHRELLFAMLRPNLTWVSAHLTQRTLFWNSLKTDSNN